MKRTSHSLATLDWPKVTLTSLVVLIVACGVNAGNPKKPDETGNPIPQEQSRDLELITAQVDETANMLADLLDIADPKSDAALSENDVPPPMGKLAEPTFACETLDDLIKNSVDHNADYEGAILRNGQTINSKITMQKHVETKWSAHGGNIICSTEGKAQLEWSKLTGYHAEVNFTASTTRIRTREGTEPREFTHHSSGTRTLDAKVVPTNDNTRMVTQTLRHSFKHERKGTGRNGPFSFVSAFMTPETDPLAMETIYDPKTDAWLKHKVKSGKIHSTIDDRLILESSFFDVEFAPNGGCLPVGGRIEGVFHEAGVTGVDRAFVVKFGSNATPQIEFADGTVIALETDVCELETRHQHPKPPPPSP